MNVKIAIIEHYKEQLVHAMKEDMIVWKKINLIVTHVIIVANLVYIGI